MDINCFVNIGDIGETYGFLIRVTRYYLKLQNLYKECMKLVGINEENIKMLSKIKKEPRWMLEKRLEAYEVFEMLSLPKWGPDLSEIDFNNLVYYLDPLSQDKPKDKFFEEIKEKLEKLGIPEQEKKFFMGMSTQLESVVVYHKIREELERMGVIYLDSDTALKEHEEIFREYFGKVVPPNNNKFAALNMAMWSGGSFIYVPKGVKVKLPLHTFFRMETPSLGQFERTLIILEDGAKVEYIEGCVAPYYSSSSLHAGVVEVVVKKGAHLKYTTLQNWSKNVYNLVTKSARVYERGIVEWFDVNFGSKVTMKYPSIYLIGDKAKGIYYSFTLASENQEIDGGAKMIHIGKDTVSHVVSKAISKDGGKNIYRGLVRINKGSEGSSSYVECDTLVMDNKSISASYPYNFVEEKNSNFRYESHNRRIDTQRMFYLMSRGINEESAKSMISVGFAKDIIRKIPLEYAVEMYKVLKLEFGEVV